MEKIKIYLQKIQNSGWNEFLRETIERMVDFSPNERKSINLIQLGFNL